jgi:hypothetical protein
MKAAARDITEPAPAREAPAVIDLPAPRPRRRGGVRRKAVNPRVADIHLRTTPDRKAAIQSAAQHAGMSITDYLLTHLPGWTETPRLVAIADPVILTRLLGEIGKWGSNWNQLTYGRNRDGRDPTLDELEAIRVAIMDMRAALLQALGQ